MNEGRLNIKAMDDYQAKRVAHDARRDARLRRVPCRVLRLPRDTHWALKCERRQ